MRSTFGSAEWSVAGYPTARRNLLDLPTVRIEAEAAHGFSIAPTGGVPAFRLGLYDGRVPLQISPELVLVTLLTLAFPFALAWGIYRLVRRAVRAGVRDAMSERNTAP